MKRLILIITIFISSSVFSQWVNLKPVPDENDLRSVYFINDNTGWMVGSSGLILKTENAGEVWRKQESNTGVMLNSIYFVNETVGWCVGNGIILNTTNGGDIWEIQLSDTIPGLNAVQFIDENKGWTVGSSGTILKTENGGINWEIVDVGITNHLNSIFFVNQLLGFIIGNGGLIMKTVDGGTTWEQSFVSGDLSCVTFVNDSLGWISGYNQILKTTDGGLNWYQVFSGAIVKCIEFINEDFGVAAIADWNYLKSNLDSGGDIITTTDGGENWHSAGLTGWHTRSFNSIFITNSGIGFAVGNMGGMCITVDNGQNWYLSYSGTVFTGGFISDLDYTTLDGINSILAVGRRGGLSNDEWAVVFRPIPNTDYWIVSQNIIYDPPSLPYLEFINDSVGYAYISWSAIKTFDRGNTWVWPGSKNKSLEGLTMEYPFRSKMFFVDEYIGFWQIIPIEGSIYLVRTTDGGSTWEYIADQNLSLRSFHFFDENTGIAASDTKIYKTTNAGLNWFEIFNQGGREILFINSFVGFVVGSNGNIFKTTNAGTDWFQVNNTGVSEDLNDIFFINENIGYVVGDNGTVLVTPNAGISWFQQDLEMNHNLHSVIFLDDNIGYIAGGGALLKTENGGGVIPVELVSLTAILNKQEVTLNWTTATETNNRGFEVERKLENTVWGKIGFVDGHGTTTETQNYQYIDNISDIQSKSLFYRLKQIDYDGSYEYSDVVEVTNTAPTDFALHQNYPNPFNPATTISYSLPVKSQVELVVYNALGETVVQLVNEEKEAGRYEAKFSATALPSGIYFYRLQSGSFIETKKMILLK